MKIFSLMYIQLEGVVILSDVFQKKVSLYDLIFANITEFELGECVFIYFGEYIFFGM